MYRPIEVIIETASEYFKRNTRLATLEMRFQDDEEVEDDPDSGG
jgi:hypothetical protein